MTTQRFYRSRGVDPARRGQWRPRDKRLIEKDDLEPLPDDWVDELAVNFVVIDGHCMPLDVASGQEALRRMIERGVDQPEICRRLKRAQSTVRQWARDLGIEFAGKWDIRGATRYETNREREVRLAIQRRGREKARQGRIADRASPAMQDEGRAWATRLD